MKHNKAQTSQFIIWLYRIEDLIVGFILFSILFFGVLQIILRNFFESGIVWGDSLLRVLVLWLGLTGAIIASRNGKQISIDILTRFIPEHYKIFVKKINFIFSAFICMTISYYSGLFVYMEYQDATLAFKNIPSWVTEIIIPIGFFVMGIKYMAQIIQKK